MYARDPANPAVAGEPGPLRSPMGFTLDTPFGLERLTGETVDAVAERAGFGNATALRHHFRAWRHTTPHAYRRAFRPAVGGRAA